MKIIQRVCLCSRHVHERIVIITDVRSLLISISTRILLSLLDAMVSIGGNIFVLVYSSDRKNYIEVNARVILDEMSFSSIRTCVFLESPKPSGRNLF
jgi:hypothetical protein